MRQFIVLGYASTSNSAEGEIISLGNDCAAATAEVHAPTKQFVRKEMYELAIPALRKIHATEEEVAEFLEAKAAAEAEAKAAAEAEAKAAPKKPSATKK